MKSVAGSCEKKEESMKEFRVMYWGPDSGDEFMEFDTMEQAQEFYDSLNGVATIQRYFAEFHDYVDIQYPTFEY
jgi:hypothetical protein